MGKRQVREETLRPLSLKALVENGFLQAFSPPTEAFDPMGNWRHSYQLWLVGGGGQVSRGFIRVERAAADGGKGAKLSIEFNVLQAAFGIERTRATIQCAADGLGTPQSWQLESVVLNLDGKPIPETQVEERGDVKGDTVQVTPVNAPKERARTRTVKVATPFTTNWSLLEAVQRLPAQGMSPLAFTLLEDGDLVKEKQRLLFRGPAKLDVNGKTVELREYQQIGEGILPYHYWVDGAGRLLFVVSGQRAYTWSPSAAEEFETMRQRMLRRAGQ